MATNKKKWRNWRFKREQASQTGAAEGTSPAQENPAAASARVETPSAPLEAATAPQTPTDSVTEENAPRREKPARGSQKIAGEVPPPPEAPLEEWDVLVGRVTGYWDKSLLKVRSFSPNPHCFRDNIYFCAFSYERKNEQRRLLTVRAARFHANSWILECGLDSTEEAESYRGAQLFIHSSMRPQLEDGSFYVDDLMGVKVIDLHGVEWGEIEEVIETPAHDVYVTPRGMIPAHPDFIEGIDWESRVLTVRDIPGLRTDEDEDSE